MRDELPLTQKGFTAFEFVFVLCLFGVLWLVQLYCLKGLSGQFRASLERSTASSVQIGLLAHFLDPKRGDTKTYPAFLDKHSGGSCSLENTCFSEVLPGGITALWKKTAPLEYLGPSHKRHTWKYNPVLGEFYLLKE